jgi:hypothetical protein
MKLSRRQFLTGLISVGATIALPISIAQATPAQINKAWREIVKNPWYFEVNEFDTIVDSSIEEPKFRRDVFDVDTGDHITIAGLIGEIEGCYPLTSHFQQLGMDELADAESTLEGTDLSSIEYKRLQKTVEALSDEDEGWAAWIRLEGSDGLPKFKAAAHDWLHSPIEWSDYEWFPKYATSQGSAMQFFESMPIDELDLLGVVIIEGDHPGSTYYAAELRQPIEDANAAAEAAGMPFRFRKEGVVT